MNVTRESLDDAMKQLGMQEGFDVGLEMSGNAVRVSRACSARMHHGGSVAMLGIPPGEVAIDWNEVVFKGLTIKGIYGREMFETWYKMAAMLQSGLEHRPHHHAPLWHAGVREGLRDDGRRASPGKVILDWATL